MPSSDIHIKGARVHNLRNLELRLPREQITVITGLSGSGKSSLAFDTIYAEGYRKFLDSLSPRMRSMLEQVPRPDVDFIHGLSPVIAVEQREAAGSHPRSTLATLTEVADYARLVWSLGGTAYCPHDGGTIEQQSLDDGVDRILALPEGTRAMVIAPLIRGKTSVLRTELPHLKVKGFSRIRVDGRVSEIEDDDALPKDRDEHQLDIVVDRIIIRPDQRSRIADSLEIAFREGRDQAVLSWQSAPPEVWQDWPLSQHLACTTCGRTYGKVTPRLFSHDHPRGACPICGGLGQTLQFREELIVPDPGKSVRSGAIKPLRLGSRRMIIRHNAILKQLSEQLPFDGNAPWRDIPDEVRRRILFGDGDREYLFKTKPGRAAAESVQWHGVMAMLEAIRRETTSEGLRNRLVTYQHSETCPDCHGERLSREAANVLLDGISYPQFMRMNLREAHEFVASIDGDGIRDALDGLEQRLRFLNQVGLSYLTLDRPVQTLSGGEAQRARLASHLGTGLVGVTYILDEPTIGLHPRDTDNLIQSIRRLRDNGNTVVVVEHDEAVIRSADYFVELGPGAGSAGGELVFAGSWKEAREAAKSATMEYLAGTRQLERSGERRTADTDAIVINDARANNLRNLRVSFPLRLISCVTGVSGSGKSTLVTDTLARAAAMKLNRAKQIPAAHGGIDGLENFDRVVIVDQEPIGRSPRSNPATYVGLFDELRRLFAKCPLSKVRGYSAGRFSFNVRGGRCERCQGDGMIRLDMHFLTDVYSECPSCQGMRYNRETLEVRYRGMNIADVLGMTVDEARDFFQHQPKAHNILDTLAAVGLGYLQLGQAANTLSGGEAQRIKLSLELSKGRRGSTLYILDEPTTGLHWSDIQHLMDLLFRLRDQGHTLIMIEHHPDVIRLADWIVELGPGAGDQGGHLVHAGPLEALLKLKASPTAKALRQ